MTTAIMPAHPAPLPGSAGPLRPPNALAEKITGRPYLSHSQLSMMRACPQAFSFRYVEKAEPESLPASLLFGGAIHSALELHFRCRLEGLTATPQALLCNYHQSWSETVESNDAPIRFAKTDDAEKLHALAGRMIEAFLGSEVAIPAGTILGVEEQMRVVLDPDLPDLLARVDLVYQNQQGLHVTDFKTSRSKWNQGKALQSADQLVLYGTTVARMSQSLELPLKLQFAVLTKAKSPQVQILEVPADAGRIETLKDGLSQVWQAICAGNFYPNPSPMHCTTCPFRSRCPIFK